MKADGLNRTSILCWRYTVRFISPFMRNVQGGGDRHPSSMTGTTTGEQGRPAAKRGHRGRGPGRGPPATNSSERTANRPAGADGRLRTGPSPSGFGFFVSPPKAPVRRAEPSARGQALRPRRETPRGGPMDVRWDVIVVLGHRDAGPSRRSGTSPAPAGRGWSGGGTGKLPAGSAQRRMRPAI